MCQNFGESKDKLAQRLQDLNRQMEAVKDSDQANQQEVFDEMNKMHASLLQELINESHRQGVDVPDKLQEQLKNSPIGSKLTLQNRMSLREK